MRLRDYVLGTLVSLTLVACGSTESLKTNDSGRTGVTFPGPIAKGATDVAFVYGDNRFLHVPPPMALPREMRLYDSNKDNLLNPSEARKYLDARNGSIDN